MIDLSADGVAGLVVSAFDPHHRDPGSIPGVGNELVLWLPGQTDGFFPGSPVSSHYKASIRLHLSQRDP